MTHAGRVTAALVVILTLVATGARTETPDENAARLRAYHDQIVVLSRRLPPGASLAELLTPVMTLAAERSVEGVAVDENRAALLALMFYVNGWNPARFVPDARDWPPARRRSLRLAGRHDLARHFAVSAVIAAAGGTPLAAAAGVYKELSDARGGSGFSFSDLLADRAGERFGGLATQSEASARDLQRRAASGLRDADVMPPVAGLADHLSDAELTRRFGGVGGAAYNDVLADITRRVLGLALYE